MKILANTEGHAKPTGGTRKITPFCPRDIINEHLWLVANGFSPVIQSSTVFLLNKSSDELQPARSPLARPCIESVFPSHSSLFRQLCMQSCGCSFGGDSWLPTETKQLPSSAEGRRWGRGRGTSPVSCPPLLVVGKSCGANPPLPGSRWQLPGCTDLTGRGTAWRTNANIWISDSFLKCCYLK